MEKTNHMTISVIIITLNRASWLKETLSSLLNQTRKPDEVIVVDNGSTDNTKDIVENFEGGLHIKFLVEKKRGIPYARNIGIKNATKKIIAFIDDDCIADKNWLKYLEIPFVKDPNIGVVGGEVSYLKSGEGIIDKFYGQNMPVFVREKT